MGEGRGRGQIEYERRRTIGARAAASSLESPDAPLKTPSFSSLAALRRISYCKPSPVSARISASMPVLGLGLG